jgi:hypothetical protein
MMNVDLLKFVTEHLAKNRGKHREIAKATGVPYTTIRNISQGVTPNPGVVSVQAIYNFFVAANQK